MPRDVLTQKGAPKGAEPKCCLARVAAFSDRLHPEFMAISIQFLQAGPRVGDPDSRAVLVTRWS